MDYELSALTTRPSCLDNDAQSRLHGIVSLVCMRYFNEHRSWTRGAVCLTAYQTKLNGRKVEKSIFFVQRKIHPRNFLAEVSKSDHEYHYSKQETCVQRDNIRPALIAPLAILCLNPQPLSGR